MTQWTAEPGFAEALLMGLTEVELARRALAEAASQLSDMGIEASMADALAWSRASRRQKDNLSALWFAYMAAENDFRRN
jgi:hypothetical protein